MAMLRAPDRGPIGLPTALQFSVNNIVVSGKISFRPVSLSRLRAQYPEFNTPQGAIREPVDGQAILGNEDYTDEETVDDHFIHNPRGNPTAQGYDSIARICAKIELTPFDVPGISRTCTVLVFRSGKAVVVGLTREYEIPLIHAFLVNLVLPFVV